MRAGLISWWISLTETRLWARLFRVGPQMTFSAGVFSLCCHSVPPGQNPCCPDGKEDSGCQQEKGLGGRNTNSVMTLVLIFAFPSTSPKPHCCPVLYIMWLYLECFWFHTSGKKKKNLSVYVSRWQGKVGGRHCLVAWVEEDTWRSRPKLPNDPLYSILQLFPSSCLPGVTEPPPFWGFCRISWSAPLLAKPVTTSPSVFHLPKLFSICHFKVCIVPFQGICFHAFIPFLFFYWNL